MRLVPLTLVLAPARPPPSARDGLAVAPSCTLALVHVGRTLGVLGLASLSFAGCELLASSDVYQCSTDGDCTARGGAFGQTACVNRTCVSAGVDATASEAGGDDAQAEAAVDAGEGGPDAASDSPWGCLGHVAWPQESPTATVLYRARLAQLTTMAPVTGLQVIACRSFDPTCSTPVASATTDDQGYFSLTVPQWFRGFYLMPTPPPSYPDMVPALLMALPPPSVSADPDASIPSTGASPLPTSADLNGLFSVINRMLPAPDAGFGQLLALATDCQGNPAAGVSIQSATTVPNETLTYYIGSDGLPSLTEQQTSAAGQCGFVDLPEGNDTITSALFGQGQRVGQVTLFMKSGFVTLAYLTPSP
jgi:hypothetical protein